MVAYMDIGEYMIRNQVASAKRECIFTTIKLANGKVYCSSSTQSKWVDHGGNEKALTFVKLTKEKCLEKDRERTLTGRSPLFAGSNE
jgi:hypothetical protein